MASTASLRDALLAPRSVALVGASDDLSKTASRPLRFLRQAGFKGNIYPVNPRRDVVLGERAWHSLSALPEVPDHAFILAGTDTVIPAIEECGRLGVPVATILASGFGEAGDKGIAREQQLRHAIAQSGVRVVGPSSLGVVNVSARLVLTANAAFAESDLPPGRIFVASHSGSMLGALVSRGKARGIGFSGLVSVGNELDLSIGEICAATLDDESIDSYLLFLETIRHGDRLRAFAIAAAEQGKPVLAYKLGRSAAAAELSVTHTGALAGEDDVAATFLKDCGIARVETLDAMLEAPRLLTLMPVRERGVRSPRVAVVTTTGGGAAMVVDQLGIRGIAVEGPGAATLAKLSAAGVDVAPGRIVDLTLAGTRYEIMKSALDVLLAAPEFDLVVAVPGSSARFEPGLAVKPLIDCAGQSKPLATFVVPDAPQALAHLTEAGIPNFRTPESCADAIAAAFSRTRPRPLQIHPRATMGEGRLVNELQAYAILDRLGIPCAKTEAIDSSSNRSHVHSIAFPVAVKLLSDRVAHKTEIGGVVLNVRNEAELSEAITRIKQSAQNRCPGTDVEHFIAQQMVAGLGEVLIGYKIDPQVGPIVMLAAGGVMTEIYRDRSLRLAPVDLDVAREMIDEVKAMRAFTGFRGRPLGDLDALASAIMALSQLAIVDEPCVIEAEINPLIVMPKAGGVVAVDALIRLV